MKVKCSKIKLTEDQMKTLSVARQHDYSPWFTVNKEYTVLSVLYVVNPEWTTILFELCDDIKTLTSAPACLFEIIDPRPSVFWRAKHDFPVFKLSPSEFYWPFFHDDLSEGKPGFKKVFDIVVDRLTYEFDDATQGLPDPLAWPFEEYK